MRREKKAPQKGRAAQRGREREREREKRGREFFFLFFPSLPPPGFFSFFKKNAIHPLVYGAGQNISEPGGGHTSGFVSPVSRCHCESTVYMLYSIWPAAPGEGCEGPSQTPNCIRLSKPVLLSVKGRRIKNSCYIYSGKRDGGSPLPSRLLGAARGLFCSSSAHTRARTHKMCHRKGEVSPHAELQSQPAP